MSRSKLHKQHGKWKNGEQESTPLLQGYFDRHNFDVAKFTVRRNELKNKIIERDMKDQFNEITEWLYS